MRKKIVQDLVSSNKRSIQDITIQKRSKPSFDIKPKISNVSSNVGSEDNNIQKHRTTDSFIDARIHIKKDDTPSKKYNFEYDFDKPRNESKKGLYISVFIFILAFAFGISSLLSKATVSIVSKRDTFPIKETIDAIKNPKVEEFGYQTINIEGSANKQIIESLSEQKVEQKAYGTLSVSNESGKSQKILANTRFEGPTGLIYRIKDPATLSVGKTDLIVYADEVGEKYNTAKDTKFTIPGFKNDPKYKTIYAIAKEDIKGGFVGSQKVLDENAKKTLNIELSAELKKNLLSQINSQTPENFIYYPNTIKYVFKDLEIEQEDGNTFAVKKGSVEVVIFDKTLLSNKIINSLKDKNDIVLPADVKNLDSLSFNIITNNINSDIKIDISGDVLIKSTFDSALLKNDLLGIKRESINDLLSAKYPGINEARVKIFPFWKNVVPMKPDKIVIKEVDSF